MSHEYYNDRKRKKRLILTVEKVRELMAHDPISIPATATVKEAAAVLIDKGISAAAVVDVVGRLVGVFSQSDVLLHHRNKLDSTQSVPEYYQQTDLSGGNRSLLTLVKFHGVDRTLVHQVMTPTVISVRPEDSMVHVVCQMVASKVHRLFVVDDDGVLVGVISAFDVLRKLRVGVESSLSHGPFARVP